MDLFPQAAGAPAAPPPSRALFEDFLGFSAPASSPVCLFWFERVRTAPFLLLILAGPLFFLRVVPISFLPPRDSSYAVWGEFALGQSTPVHPSLLSLFVKQLKSSFHVGLSFREAATWGASLRSQSAAIPFHVGPFLGCYVS